MKTKKRFKVEMYVDTYEYSPKFVQREVDLAINAAIQAELVEIKSVSFVRAKLVKAKQDNRL